jgi:thiol-disulfide isomerase/thioredoxin
MKQILTFFLLIIAGNVLSQGQFEVISDPEGKILKGVLAKRDIASDTAFKWYAANQKGYTAQADAVNALKKNGERIRIIAFGGTWCGDTKYILPKFYSITESANFSDDRITLIGVDRSKKTIGHLTEALAVVNVPTFIVFKDGKEIGRVVEYGKTGQWDKELAEIVNQAEK